MDKILELREKRAKAWEAAKAFLDSKRGADGLLSVEVLRTGCWLRRMWRPMRRWRRMW